MRRLFGILVAVSLTACGRGGFDFVPDAAPDALPDAPPDAPPDAGACGAGYDRHPDGQLSTYRTGVMSSWEAAEAACEADGYGAHLVVFDNSLEMNASEGISMSFGRVPFWIGLSDRVTDMSFIPVIGGVPPFLPSWAPNAPSIVGPSCVLFDPNARTLQDTPCATPAYYVCECDGLPARHDAY